jgi:hypothetical protein
VKIKPATVIVPLRAALAALGATATLIVPGPVKEAAEVSVSQEALLTALQLHPDAVRTAIAMLFVPLAGAFAEAAPREYEQDAVTVTARGAA